MNKKNDLTPIVIPSTAKDLPAVAQTPKAHFLCFLIDARYPVTTAGQPLSSDVARTTAGSRKPNLPGDCETLQHSLSDQLWQISVFQGLKISLIWINVQKKKLIF